MVATWRYTNVRTGSPQIDSDEPYFLFHESGQRTQVIVMNMFFHEWGTWNKSICQTTLHWPLNELSIESRKRNTKCSRDRAEVCWLRRFYFTSLWLHIFSWAWWVGRNCQWDVEVIRGPEVWDMLILTVWTFCYKITDISTYQLCKQLRLHESS